MPLTSSGAVYYRKTPSRSSLTTTLILVGTTSWSLTRQGVLHPEYLDVLDLILKGGLSGGRWRFSAISRDKWSTGKTAMSCVPSLTHALAETARFGLKSELPDYAPYRHTLASPRKDGPRLLSRVLRPDDRLEPQISYYAKPSQQCTALVRALEALYAESFSGSDVVILSPKATPRSAAARIVELPWRDRLAPYDQASDDQVGYTTIHSFKGLECLAIVVTDIEHLDSEHFCSLFYVATTRALHRLYILVHETAKQDIVKALIGKAPEWK